MTNLIDALTDLKTELVAGVDPDLAIATIAEDYGLKPVFLRNRANAVLGDLTTWAERDRVARAALAPTLEAARQKMARAQMRNTVVTRTRRNKACTFDQAMDAIIKLMKAEGVDVAEIEKLFRT